MALLTQIHNPVLWQEITHQERSTPRWTQRTGVVGILALVFFLVYVTTALVNSPGYPTTLFLLYAIWILHIATALRALVAGANVISSRTCGPNLGCAGPDGCERPTYSVGEMAGCTPPGTRLDAAARCAQVGGAAYLFGGAGENLRLLYVRHVFI